MEEKLDRMIFLLEQILGILEMQKRNQDAAMENMRDRTDPEKIMKSVSSLMQSMRPGGK